MGSVWRAGSMAGSPGRPFTVHAAVSPTPGFTVRAPAKELQRGRSLAAAEQLSRVGYGTLAWINGGLDTAKKSDLPIKGEFDDLRYGGIGGLSELLGWTDVQREKSAGFLGAAQGSRPCCNAVLSVVAAVLALKLQEGSCFGVACAESELRRLPCINAAAVFKGTVTICDMA